MRELPQELEQILLDALDRHGLAKHREMIRSRARLTFLLRVSPQGENVAAPVGRSRLGGEPDLPLGESWATSEADDLLLDFIAQINLAEVPAMGQPLPQAGMLYIYAQQESSANNEHSIKLLPAENLRRREIDYIDDEFSDEDSEVLPDLLIEEFVPSVSLPDATAFPEFDDSVYEAYQEMVVNLHQLATQKEPTSRLLGYPSMASLDEGRELLIEAQSFFHDGICYMNYWDAGFLVIEVATSELSACEFRDSQASLYSN